MLMTTCMKINQCASPAAGRLAAVVLFLAVTGPVVGTTHAAVISSSVRLEATTAFGGNQDFQSVELQQAIPGSVLSQVLSGRESGTITSFLETWAGPSVR